MSRCMCTTMCPWRPAWRRRSREPSVSMMPPPHAITTPAFAAWRVSVRRSASRARNAGQPFASTNLIIGIPTFSIARSSRSRNGRRIRRASSRPMVVLPAPRIPIRMQCASLGFRTALARASSGCESAAWRVAPRVRRRWSQYSGYVFSTHSFSVITSPGRRHPRTPKDMAMRWSSWHTIVAPPMFFTPPQPWISMPSSSSPHLTPHLPSSDTITAMRLHSLTRWFATPRIRVTPVATAARTAAVMNASVIVSMSMSPRPLSCPAGGPVTVVSLSSWVTVHPILPSRWQNAASPWTLPLPTAEQVILPPVIAAIARG
mmetsp:Transcript_10942/g.26571  ORF Transcript_10942/g.26571 Transcript_10942/m.26571 type:complete len:317 (-) Transcript_10942:1898-2848(-)